MILVDANVLLYAVVADYAEHERSRAWLEQQFNSSIRVGLPWPTLLAFLRLITNSRVFERPLAYADAWQIVMDWLAHPNTFVPVPTPHHAEFLGRWTEVITRAELVPDAHLAALALEYSLSLATTDGDFARFEGLHWFNPLHRSPA